MEVRSGSPLLQTKGLTKYFKTSRGMLHAVDHVDLQIQAQKTLGVVGESGCGKSTLGRTILRLIQPTDGSILYRGEDIVHYSTARMREMRRKMQIIFQDPYASLDPRKTVKDLIADPLKVYKTPKSRRDELVGQMMETVGLAERFAQTYPHELDGPPASGSALRGRWCYIRNLLSATSRFQRWMFLSRHRFSIC